jgi:hypothetical protein
LEDRSFAPLTRLLIQQERASLQALIWKVTSLAQAKQVLSEKGLLGIVGEQRVTLALSKMQGLDNRLVEQLLLGSRGVKAAATHRKRPSEDESLSTECSVYLHTRTGRSPFREWEWLSAHI